MPMLPADPAPPKQPWYTRGPIIAAVGGVAAALVALIALLIPLEPGVTVAAVGVVGSLLALWRSGTGNPPPSSRTGTAGPMLLVLLVFSGAWYGCATATTPVHRDGAARLANAAIQATAGALLIAEYEDEARLVAATADGIVGVTIGSLEYPADTDQIADGIVDASAAVLEAKGLDTAAELVRAARGIVRWVVAEAAVLVESVQGRPSVLLRRQTRHMSEYIPIRGPTPGA